VFKGSGARVGTQANSACQVLPNNPKILDYFVTWPFLAMA
jgi:hypothetical protein